MQLNWCSQSRLVRRALMLLLILFGIINHCILHKRTISLLDLVTKQETEEDLSGFPKTRFITHVNEVVTLYDFDRLDKCENEYHFMVTGNRPSLPTVSCELNKSGKGVNVVSGWWCTVLKRVFAPEKRRPLPHNVSFAVSIMDYLDHFDMHSCVGSSAYKGNFSMMNFHEVQRMDAMEEYRGKPWDNRSTIPIWRGTPWINLSKLDRTKDESTLYNQVLSVSPRLRAVDWSMHNPSLLDARIHQHTEDMEVDEIFFENSMSGIHMLLTKPQYIPEGHYYTENQVALVLCGLGASFRTTVHLITSTAVVLQDCAYHEWFAGLMTPMRHYIPLAQDLHDLGKRMKWIKKNPAKVRSIAENGRQFYLDYLSFERNEEHIYEFVYRLSLARAQYEKALTANQRKEMERRQNRRHTPVETVSHRNDGEGNVEELEVMCQELLSRAGDTEEGKES